MLAIPMVPTHPPIRLRRGLYLVTRDEPDSARLLAIVAAALAGGAVAVQYRDKSLDRALRLAQARALVDCCSQHGVPLIVNDDPELAREAGATGVHLGEHDATLAAARAVLGPNALIGVSCYDDAARAHAAARAGADYVAFGAFHASPTKPGARRADPSLFAATAGLGLPRVAIGGINRDNAAPLVSAGADLVAVISAIWDAPDPKAEALAFARLFEVESFEVDPPETR